MLRVVTRGTERNDVGGAMLASRTPIRNVVPVRFVQHTHAIRVDVRAATAPAPLLIPRIHGLAHVRPARLLGRPRLFLRLVARRQIRLEERLMSHHAATTSNTDGTSHTWGARR